MHNPPRLRGGLVARLAALLVVLFLFALAIVFQLESELGLSPWDVLHQGIADHTALSFGEANICVGLVVVALAWALGAKIGVGTVANVVLVGGFIIALTAIPAVDHLSEHGLGVRIVLLVLAMPMFGIASALYLGAWLGAGPRDSLMVVLGRRTGFRLGIVRAGIEIAALGAGWALGGTVGIGTLVFAVGIGPALEGGFWALQRSRFGVPVATPVELPLANCRALPDSSVG